MGERPNFDRLNVEAHQLLSDKRRLGHISDFERIRAEIARLKQQLQGVTSARLSTFQQ